MSLLRPATAGVVGFVGSMGAADVVGLPTVLSVLVAIDLAQLTMSVENRGRIASVESEVDAELDA
jgi:hypothetical protein